MLVTLNYHRYSFLYCEMQTVRLNGNLGTASVGPDEQGIFRDLALHQQACTRPFGLVLTSTAWFTGPIERLFRPAIMPVPRAVGLRPAGALSLSRQCLRSTSPLVLRSESCRRRQHKALALLVTAPTVSQLRSKSTYSPNPNPEGSSQQGGQQPKPTLKAMLWRAIVADSKRAWRNLRSSSLREVIKKNPGEALGAIAAYVL